MKNVVDTPTKKQGFSRNGAMKIKPQKAANQLLLCVKKLHH